MNPKPHKTVFVKSVWATGRPGSFMEMRRPAKQRLPEQWAPLSQSCLGGKNESQALGASVPVAASSPLCWGSSWPCPAGELCFDPQRQFLCDWASTLLGLWQPLFVCLFGMEFLGFSVPTPRMAFDSRLNNFCPPSLTFSPFTISYCCGQLPGFVLSSFHQM